MNLLYWKYKESHEAYRKKNHKKIKMVQEKQNNLHRFGMHKTHSELVSMFGGRCVICGKPNSLNKKETKASLSLHHIDRKGRNSETQNHDPKNLLLLCHSCHMKEHAKDINKYKPIPHPTEERII